MLAEPKRKTVWSLNPRGKLWSEDKTKIGQKLLESMGWKEGLGLGKNNNGIKDHIRLDANSENKGLGYKPSSDTVWVDKNQDYEQLLANLAVHHNSGSKRGEVKVSNLEETSKKLKNRLHYSKVIKSKNLSQCSENDLNSIFPKKFRKIAEQTIEMNKTEDIKEPINTYESTTNINDYFKSKMDKLKLKFKLIESNSTKVEETVIQKFETTYENKTNDIIEDNNELNQGKKRKSKQLIENSDNSVEDSNCGSNPKKIKKLKNKYKRIKEEKAEQSSDITDNSSAGSECQSTEQNIKKIKRNKKEKPTKELISDEIKETDSQSSNGCSEISIERTQLETQKYAIRVPKGYNLWNISVMDSLKNHHNICEAITKDEALSTTNLVHLKGYGCHSI